MLGRNEVTISLPRVLAKISSKAAITLVSDPVNPGLDVRAVREQGERHHGTQIGEAMEIEVLTVNGI